MSKTNHVSKCVNRHFERVIRDSCAIQKLETDLSFHNVCRLETIPKGKETYCGRLKCGITTFVLGHLLKESMTIGMYKSKFGYGKYVEDHVFLKCGDLIIDPTYRQFFTDNRSVSSTSTNSGRSEYNDYLYSLPPFFVGTRDQLQELSHQLEAMHSHEFDYNPFSKDRLDHWREDYCLR